MMEHDHDDGCQLDDHHNSIMMKISAIIPLLMIIDQPQDADSSDDHCFDRSTFKS